MTSKFQKTQLHTESTPTVPAAPTDTTPSAGFSRNTYLLALAVALFTFALYLPALRNGFVNWDDFSYIFENPHIRSLNLNFFRWASTNTDVAYWHPLTWLSHALDYLLWGLKPAGHHLSSIVCHAANSGIAVLLTTIILGLAYETGGAVNLDRKNIYMAAGTTGILFAVHPLHVESAVWLSQRKDLLYSMFYMLSMICYLRCRTGSSPAYTFYRNRDYFLALVMFFLALCSKPMAVTLPVVLLLLDWYPLDRIKTWKNFSVLLLEKLPFAALSIIISISTIIAQKNTGDLKSLEVATVGVRILVAFRALALYLWKIIVPAELLPLYAYPRDASILRPEYPAAVLFVLLLTSACGYVVRKKPQWLAAWLFFLINLFPVLGFLQAGMQSMADRYVYLAALGVFLPVGVLSAKAWTGCKRAAVRYSVTAAALVLVILLSYLTVKQTAVWQSSVTLWSYQIARERIPSANTYFLRAGAYRDEKLLNQAFEDYSKAAALEPKFLYAYFDRGELLLENGRYDLAIEDYSRVIELDSEFTDAYIGRGKAYYVKGEREKALEEFNSIISRKPSAYKAYASRGVIHKNNSEIDKAFADFDKALSIKPDFVNIYLARGDLYSRTGAIDRALRDYQKACELGSEAGCQKQLFPFGAPEQKKP